MNSNKELNESKRPQNRETTRGEGTCLQKTDTDLTLNELVANPEECGTSGLSCDGEVGEFFHGKFSLCSLLQFF